jgi:hypothetical protein
VAELAGNVAAVTTTGEGTFRLNPSRGQTS